MAIIAQEVSDEKQKAEPQESCDLASDQRRT